MRLLLIAILSAAIPALAQAAPELDPAKAPAGHYELDPAHTSVLASVMHLGLSHFTVRLSKTSGDFDYDPTNPAASKIRVTLDARSLDVGNSLVDKLFETQFLDALSHPQISFVSDAIQPDDLDHGQVMGQLTFRGVTRPAAMRVTYNGFDTSLAGGQRMGFSGALMINRSDYGSTFLQGDVGDEVKIVIETEFVRK